MSESGCKYGAPRCGSKAPSFEQSRSLGRSADTSNERAINNMVTAAELRLLAEGQNTPLETVDWSWRVTKQSMEDIAGDWRGNFSTWLTHPRCTMESTEGPESRGDDRFGLAARGGAGSPRRRTFHPAEILLKIDLQYMTELPGGAPIYVGSDAWRPMTSSVE